MQTILIVVHLFFALGIIALVLIQHGKGADAGAAFGSGASATVFGARGSTSFLSHATAILAALFFVTSLALAYYASQNGKPRAGIMDQVPASTDKAMDQAQLPSIPPAESVTTIPKTTVPVVPVKSPVPPVPPAKPVAIVPKVAVPVVPVKSPVPPAEPVTIVPKVTVPVVPVATPVPPAEPVTIVPKVTVPVVPVATPVPLAEPVTIVPKVTAPVVPVATTVPPAEPVTIVPKVTAPVADVVPAIVEPDKKN